MSRKDTSCSLAPHLTVLLFLFAVTSPSTVSGDQILDISLPSWGHLQTQAGYFTEGGRWKGGLPKKARKEADIYGSCKEVPDNGTFCQSWTVEEERENTYGKGNCKCRKNTGAYCEEWTCLEEQTKRTCKRRHGKRCTATPKEMHVENCVCLEAANSGAHCLRWKCSEEGRRGRSKHSTYICLATDVSEEFCHLWNGESASDREVESVACQCSYSGDGHCNHWQCQARTLLRCSKHKGGWCRLGISLGVFGALGLLFLSGGMAIIFEDVFKGKASAWYRGKILIIYFWVLVFPWGIGVAITGGMDGIKWAALMWCIPFLLLGLALLYSRRTSVAAEASSVVAEPSSVLTTPLKEPPQVPVYSYDGKTYVSL